ncbi:methylenetetrahydrofolate reductase [Thermodesulfobacteriota bacterium]
MSFQKRLSSGEFVVLVEMNTPKGVDISELVTNARHLKGRVDAIVVPDMDNGIMKLNALAGGVLLQQQGMEAVIHVYGRDRNKMALQGDLLGAHVLGIQNLIVVKGEDMSYADHRDARPVDDLDELGLLAAIQSLQEGVDLAGFDLNGSPSFTAGCAMAPFADDDTFSKEIDLAARKIEAGARFIVTPPVYNLEYSAKFLEKLSGLKAPVIASVFLLKSVGVARYIARNEPGANITDAMIKRIRKSPDRETEGLKITAETIAGLKPMVQGVKIAALGWEHRIPYILEFAGM